MKINITAAQIEANPNFMYPMLSALFGREEWDEMEMNRGWLQAILDVGISATGIRAYSSVVTEAQTNADVPAGWPDNMITPMTAPEVPATYDDDGNELTPYIPPEYGTERRKTFREYSYAYEVTGGWVVRFTATAVPVSYDPATGDLIQGGIKNLNTSQFSTWVGVAGGFLTEAEVAALRIAP